jgi:hypothetical protein
VFRVSRCHVTRQTCHVTYITATPPRTPLSPTSSSQLVDCSPLCYKFPFFFFFSTTLAVPSLETFRLDGRQWCMS